MRGANVECEATLTSNEAVYDALTQHLLWRHLNFVLRVSLGCCALLSECLCSKVLGAAGEWNGGRRKKTVHSSLHWETGVESETCELVWELCFESTFHSLFTMLMLNTNATLGLSSLRVPA